MDTRTTSGVPAGGGTAVTALSIMGVVTSGVPVATNNPTPAAAATAPQTAVEPRTRLASASTPSGTHTSPTTAIGSHTPRSAAAWCSSSHASPRSTPSAPTASVSTTPLQGMSEPTLRSASAAVAANAAT